MKVTYDALRGLPGRGEVPASYAIVGIAPSTKRPADRKFEPFGARSHKIIENIRRRVDSLYVTNAVKTPHPPGKPPRISEIRSFTHALYEELSLVSPRRILALGDIPARLLCGDNFRGLREDRGTFFWNERLEAFVIPTYHFAAGGRNPSFQRYISRDIERFFGLPDPTATLNYLLFEDPTILPIPAGTEVVLDVETTGLEWDATITQVGLTWTDDYGEPYPPYLLMDPTKHDLIALGKVLRAKRCTITGHNLAFDLRCLLHNTDGQWPRSLVHDTMILAHLTGEDVLGLKHLSTLYTDRPGPHFGGGPGDPLYLAEDVESTRLVADHFRRDRERFAYTVLRDLVPLVAAIYHRGVFINRPRLVEIEGTAETIHGEKLAQLESITGTSGVNWNSAQQVVDVLLKAGVPLEFKTDAGQYSVKESVLLALEDRHPVARQLLEYRAAEKMLTGFIRPYLASTSDESPYLRPTLRLTGTATGRLSCANPNLQQVTREGPLKEVFVPRWAEGFYGLVDLSQAELRIAALLSGDELLAEALLAEDTHRFIASKVFRKPQEAITATERKASKKITFGVLYGGSAAGLALKSDLPQEVVMEILTMITQEFPRLAKWMRVQHRNALETGRIETLFGRIRLMDKYLARGDVSRVRRLAVNTPVQSLASDCMLVVTRYLDSRLRENKHRSRILFGVHDSLLTEVYPGEQRVVAQYTQEAFQDLWRTPLASREMFSVLPLIGTFILGKSWAGVESTNGGYAPLESWECSSAREQSHPKAATVLSQEDDDEDWEEDED